MTLADPTLADVAGWDLEQLRSAAATVAALADAVDQTVASAAAERDELDLAGAAADALAARMAAQQAAATTVVVALTRLQQAMAEHVPALASARAAVLHLRAQAEDASDGVPPLVVAAHGAVSAAQRVAWIRGLRTGPGGEPLFSQHQLDDLVAAAYGQAMSWQLRIVAALQHAQAVAQELVAVCERIAADLAADATGDDPDEVPVAEQVRVTGAVTQWIAEALRVLRGNGYPLGASDAEVIAAIIDHESGGDPYAINTWDSNAAMGQPSKGLMQTIDSTFGSYALPGHHDIWNPVDNIIAGTRYALDRYGSLDNVPGVTALRAGGSYVGY